MKKGISIWAFPDGTKLSDAFRMAKKAGFDGVEVALSDTGELTLNTTPAELAAIRKEAEQNGIALYSVATAIYWKYPFTSPDPAIASKAMEYGRCQIDMAAALGCDSILVVPGMVSGEGEPFGNIPYDVAYDRALTCMKELAKLAANKGVALGIENVWNKFLLSPLEMRRFVDEVGQGAYAYFDAGNVLVNGYPDHWIDILGKRICKVHVKDFKRSVGNINGFVDLFAGDVNFRAVTAALRRVGYDGFVTAEVSPYHAAPELLLRSVSTALDEIFSF
ncbi:MAG: sugar phosphate isomerase/epimerase [Clostridia bacterium]|nr:sugar phosphate isomerase/epimerase [Clostridia bacterium]